MEIIGIVLLAAAIIIALALLYTLPTMWLWNWLCPALFGFPEISFWQSLGLLCLCGFLFKSSNTSSSSK